MGVRDDNAVTEGSSAVVNGKSPTAFSSSENLKKRRRLTFLIIGALVAVAVVIGFLITYTKNGTALKVTLGDQSMTLSKAEYRQLSQQAKKAGVTSDATIKNTITDAYKSRIVAERLKVTPTEDEVQQAYAARSKVSTDAVLNGWQKLNGYMWATQNVLLFTEKGGSSGTLLYYPYDQRYINNESGVYDPSSTIVYPKDYGNLDAIKADKAYALKTATADQVSISDKKTTADMVKRRIASDGRLQFSGASNDSFDFRVDPNGGSYLAGTQTVKNLSSDATAAVAKLTQPGVSPIMQEVLSYPQVTVLPGFPTTTDSAYYFIVVDRVTKADDAIQTQFTNTLKQVKAT